MINYITNNTLSNSKNSECMEIHTLEHNPCDLMIVVQF